VPRGPNGRRSYRLVSHYLVYPAVIIVTLLLVTVVSVRVLREAVYDTHRRDLQVVVRIIRNVLPPQALTDRSVATAFCLRTAADTGVRITVIGGNGTVLGDSHADAREMENHAGRPEVRQALGGVEGISVRYSATVEQELIYAALPVYRTDAPGKNGSPAAVSTAAPSRNDARTPDSTPVQAVVRGSLVVDDVEARLATLYRRLIIPGILLISAALFAAARLSRAIRTPLRELHAAATAYAAGDLNRPIQPGGPRELTELATTFESMARQLQRRIHELEEQRRETEEVLNTIREPLLLLDAGTRIQRVNAAAVRFLGVPAESVRNRMLLELFRNSAIDAFIREVRETDGVAEREIATFETPERRLRLWAVHLTSETSLLRDQTLLVIRDVTPEYRINQIRKDFVANVSHELKTPLTMIQGAIETLTEISPEDAVERHRFEEMIGTHTARMTTIVEDLLNLARVEQEVHVTVAEEVAIAPLIRDCVTAITGDAPGPDGHSHVSISVPEELTWRVHPTLFPLAVKNLVDNAIRHGEGRADAPVTIAAHTQEDTLVITVADHGAGIPAQEIERIFERFYRVDSGRSRSHGGTGLGLSIVRHVARVHGGTVTVESSPGRGSSFTIRIPGGQS
jgi:two-component system phosphate regulon sensor histidine kinase PhoR